MSVLGYAKMGSIQAKHQIKINNTKKMNILLIILSHPHETMLFS
jgi:hypothetical protein